MKTNSTDLALTEVEEVSAPVARKSFGQVFDLTNTSQPLPDLSKADVIPLDLMSDYWSPEYAGEFKNVFFVKIDQVPTIDEETGETKILECAFFLERDQSGEIKQIRNASKRLVGAMHANNMQMGAALKITYMGKKKNRTNSRESQNWSIKMLQITIEAA